MFTIFPRLRERKDQLAGTMSGGEQQMLAMGRALMSQPKGAAARRAIRWACRPSWWTRSSRWCATCGGRQGVTIVLVEQNASRLQLPFSPPAAGAFG